MPAPDRRLLELLAACDPTVSELALALREMVLEEAPGAAESYFQSYAVVIALSRTGRMKDQYCHIVVYARHVNLGFNRGAAMRDPDGVLEGSGKQIRHIRISSEGDLRRPYLRRYIRQSIELVDGTTGQGRGVLDAGLE